MQTVEAKEGYERFTESHDMKLKSFPSDNGIFAEKVFKDYLAEASQTITYCGVGAHHQNGITERERLEVSLRGVEQIFYMCSSNDPR